MKNKTYHTVGTAAQSNLKVVERGKVDIPNTYTRHIHIPGCLFVVVLFLDTTIDVNSNEPTNFS
jgi:hypothetical protein